MVKIQKRGKEEDGWVHYVIVENGVVKCHADTEEEAHRMIEEDDE